MNKLKLYAGQHPLKNDDFNFLQDSYYQGLQGIVSAFAVQGNGYIVLEGCIPVLNQSLSTSLIDVYDVPRGFLVFDYEIIFCPSQQISVPVNVPLQYRIDEQPVQTGTRQYANGIINECHFLRNIVVEEYNQIGADVTSVMQIGEALINILKNTNSSIQSNISLQNGWQYNQSFFEFSKNVSSKIVNVSLIASQNFISAQASNQVPFTEIIANIPVAFAPKKNYSCWVEFNGVSQNGAIRLCAVLLKIKSNGEVSLTKVNNEQNYSEVQIHVNYL